MKNIIATAGKTRASIAGSMSAPALLYDLYDPLPDISDKLGNAPDLTPSGTTTGIDANAGWFTGTGSARFQSTGNTVINNVFSSNKADQIIISFSVFVGAALATNSYLFSYGRLTNTTGGFGIFLLSNSRFRFDVRDVGASSNGNYATTAVQVTDARMAVTCDVNVANGTVDFYVGGQVVGSAASLDLSKLVTNENTGGLVLCGRMGTSAPDSIIDSNVRMSDFLAVRLTTPDTTLAAKINSAMTSAPHEVPWELENL